MMISKQEKEVAITVVSLSTLLLATATCDGISLINCFGGRLLT